MNIETGEILSGSFPRRAEKLVLEWLSIHRSELLEDWKLAAGRWPEAAQEDRTVGVRNMTPRIETAEYVESYKIRLTFSDGKTRIIDLEGELWGEIFEPLKNLETFRQFKINQELRTIVWPNGADLAPEFLYELAA